jgi:uncharacterized alpha-E superfamily protein
MVATDVTEQRAAQQARFDAAIAQREVLVREVHHRIKNNLQGVAGLLQQIGARRPEMAAAMSEVAERNPHAFFQRVRNEAQLIQGLADATLAHDECWHFVRLGTFLERADNVAHTLALQAHLLRDDGRNEADMVRWISVLRSCGAAEGYARYYSLRVEPARVVEFLLLNSQFPQSVRFSLQQAWKALRALSADDASPIPRHAASAATRALGLLSAQLEHAAVDEIIESGLQRYLNDVQRDLARVTDLVTRIYLRDEPHEGRLVGVARAIRLMAEQQQQERQAS